VSQSQILIINETFFPPIGSLRKDNELPHEMQVVIYVHLVPKMRVSVRKICDLGIMTIQNSRRNYVRNNEEWPKFFTDK